MSFRIFGTRFRAVLPGMSADPVQVSASAPNKSIVYVTKPFHRTGGEQSFGMSPDQARAVAQLLTEAANWCDDKANVA